MAASSSAERRYTREINRRLVNANGSSCGYSFEHAVEKTKKQACNIYIFDGPLEFVRQHAIHGRDYLDGHVDEAFADNEADMFCAHGWIKERLEGRVEGGVRRGVTKYIFS